MIHAVGLARRSRHIARAAFATTCESHLASWRERPRELTRYRRNYVASSGVAPIEGVEHREPPCDLLVEIGYEGSLDGAAALNTLRDLLRVDSLDPTSVRTCLIERFETPSERLAARPAGHAGPPGHRMIALMRHKQGMSRDAFINYYETGHARLALELFRTEHGPCLAVYSRSYPLSGASVDFDVMTEITFWSQKAFYGFLGLLAEPECALALSRDEANLFDRSTILNFAVEQFLSC